MLFARSGCLIASSNNVRYSLCIFQPTSVTKNTRAHTYLGRENTVHEKPRLTGTNVTALQVWASLPCWTQTNWNGYLCLACFWWIQECFLCPSCPAVVWKHWFDGYNPFAPGDFEASRVVFWSLSCYKELKLTTNRFAGRTLRGLLIQMQNISLRSSGMRIKQNFKIVFGFKSDTAVLTVTFRFLSSLLFSLFLPDFFSCWAFSRLHFGGNSF